MPHHHRNILISRVGLFRQNAVEDSVILNMRVQTFFKHSSPKTINIHAQRRATGNTYSKANVISP